MEMLQARREWQEIFQVMKTRGLQLRLLYPARLSIKVGGHKELPGQKKAKRIHVHQTSTARYAKGTALRRGRKTVSQKGTNVERE